MGVVECTTYIGESALSPTALLSLPSTLLNRAKVPTAVLSGAGGVSQQRPSANRRVFDFRCCRKQRTRAYTSVEVGVGVAQERRRNRMLSCICRWLGQKGRVPIRRVAYGSRTWIWCVCWRFALVGKAQSRQAQTGPS